MRKLLYLICVIIFSSCESKFDGLQGGVFKGSSTQVTFDDNKAYFSSVYNENTNYTLSFRMLESNSKILQEFSDLFKKYNVEIGITPWKRKSTFTYHFVNSLVEEHLYSSGSDFFNEDEDWDTFLMREDHPLNLTGFKIYGSFKGLPLSYKSVVDKKYDNKVDEIDESLFRVLFKKHEFDVNDEYIVKSFNKGEKLTFIFEYKKVGQNQILLNKSPSKPNYLDYEDLKNELENLISKYENIGYSFKSKTFLNFFSHIQKIEDDYLKSNYYLNKSEDGYTLENLEHNFSYTEVR